MQPPRGGPTGWSTIEAAKPPAVMRAKLEMPEADGMRSGSTPSSEIVTMARKNVAIADALDQQRQDELAETRIGRESARMK